MPEVAGLSERRVHTTLPVANLERARAFYEGLGFRAIEVYPTAVVFGAGVGSVFAISLGSARSTGAHTQMAFRVPDIEPEVVELKARGIVLEEYDLPGLRTVGGIAAMGSGRAAWFKDVDGNLIAVIQLASG